MCNHVIEHIERMRGMQAIKSENMPKFITDVWDMVLKNDKEGVCCICGNHYDNYGNNAKPFKSGRCCDKCDNEVVIPDFYQDDNLGEQYEGDGGNYFGKPSSGTDWCFIKQITDNWYYYELHWG